MPRSPISGFKNFSSFFKIFNPIFTLLLTGCNPQRRQQSLWWFFLKIPPMQYSSTPSPFLGPSSLVLPPSWGPSSPSPSSPSLSSPSQRHLPPSLSPWSLLYAVSVGSTRSHPGIIGTTCSIAAAIQRTRAKACPKQCCYRPDATQPPATLGMWKWFNIITLWYYDIKYFRISYQNHVCLMTCLVCLRGCKCICLGKTHISGMMSSYNMSAILESVLYEPLSWKYIISRSPSSLLIELTFRGLRNFSAVGRLLITQQNGLVSG